MRHLRLLVLALLLAMAGALAACSDDDGDAGPDVELDDRDLDDRDDTDDGDEPTDEGDDGDDGDEPTDDDGEGPDDDGGELPAGAAPYVEAMVASLTADQGEGAFVLTEAQARCSATRIVAIVRVDRLEAAGISPEAFAEEADLAEAGLSIDDGRAIYDAFADCDADWYELFIESFSRESSDPAAARACMQSAISPLEMREAMARSLIDPEFDDSEESDALFEAFFTCAFDA